MLRAQKMRRRYRQTTIPNVMIGIKLRVFKGGGMGKVHVIDKGTIR